MSASADGPNAVDGSGSGGLTSSGEPTGAGGLTGSGEASGVGELMGTGGLSGSIANGGLVATAGAGGTDVVVPVYEQDDPSLHPPDSAYQRVQIPVTLNAVMSIDIDADENAYVLERVGSLRIWKADGRVVDAGALIVFAGNEDGALSISLDPNFSTNHWVYIYYSSSTASENVLSRFELYDDTLHVETERVLLRVPDQRQVQYHVGGGTDFDSKGNLYLALGDNTDPFQSNGYSPHDERAGRALFDAQRSAGNSRDLRGKILRIKPNDDGTYSIPEGNLFSLADGRPEIYTMGNRNPFRIAIDRATDWLYWGEVGPDAPENGDALATRGPKGYDEFNQAKSAGNFGWPHCIGNNIPYVRYDFGAQTSGAPFNCAGPVNSSPNNTGVRTLPPAQPAWTQYSYGSSPYPAFGAGGSRTALAGAVYRWKPGGSASKLPRYFDGSVFLMEYSRGWLVEVRTDADGRIASVNPFFPTLDWDELIQMRISPNGVLYVAQHTGEPTVYRMEYVGSRNQTPAAVARANIDSGPTPLSVQFSSAGSTDRENQPLTYAWDFESDGTVDSTQANPPFVYAAAGLYQAKLSVSDGETTGTASVSIIAGNSRPVVTIASPPNGAFIDQGELVDYTLTVRDTEDGTTPGGIPCNTVTATPALGHDLHEHDGTPASGCSGSVRAADGIIASENSWQMLNAVYTDRAPDELRLIGRAALRLHFKRIEAEHYGYIGEGFDVRTEQTEDPEGGALNVGYINDGSYICWNEMNFTNITSVSYRVASMGTGGRIEVHRDSIAGPLLGTPANVPITGGWQDWITVTAPITDPGGGTHKTCFLFKNNAGDELLFNVNWIDFVGDGVSHP